METNVRAKGPKAFIAKICAVLFLLIMIVFTLYPIVYTVLGSLKTNAELTAGGSFLPKSWQFQNYYQAFIQADFVKYTGNSVILAVSTTLLAVITCALAGFIFARRDFTGKKLLLGLYTSMMFISLGSVTLYPIYQFLHDVGLSKSMIGLILALTGGQAMNVLLVMGFVKGIPKELDEAATIDGCSWDGIFTRIILPMCTPILATVGIFSAVNQWNSFQDTLIYMTDSKLYSLQYLLYTYINQASALANAAKANSANVAALASAATPTSIRMTVSVIVVLPIMFTYPFFQRFFVKGMMLGAVKG